MNAPLLQRFEAYLHSHLPTAPSFHPYFSDALGEMVAVGGKRFRPMLLLGVVECLKPLLVENAMPAALAVELLHTYSLIHDDLPDMDNAALRRGHPTLHVRYDPVTAILVGDALNTHAFYVIAEAPLADSVKTALVRTLAVGGGLKGMVLGQAIDCYFERHPLTREQLRFLHIHKTGTLIAASLVMGAHIADCSAQVTEELHAIGIELGLLFQIVDDIIDATQSSEVAGQPTGCDGVKNSFVTLYGLQGALEAKEASMQLLRTRLAVLEPALGVWLSELLEHYFS